MNECHGSRNHHHCQDGGQPVVPSDCYWLHDGACRGELQALGAREGRRHRRALTTFDVEWQIAHVKNMMANTRSWPLDGMRVIFAGRVLRDEQTVDEVGLKANAVVVVMAKRVRFQWWTLINCDF